MNDICQLIQEGFQHAAPDAVIDAIRLLYDDVLELDPEVSHVLAALHPPS